MLKNRLKLCLFLIGSMMNNYNFPMEHKETECVEFEKSECPEPTKEYTEEIYRLLMECIKLGNINGCRKVIAVLNKKFTSSTIHLVINRIDLTSQHTPLTLAKTLPDGRNKRKIISMLKKNGVPSILGRKHFEGTLGALDRKFLLRQEKLMISIQKGSVEEVKIVLEKAYSGLAEIISNVKNDFQFIILLNESDHYSGHTPLTLATENRSLSIAKLLIQAGAFPRKANKNGTTPQQIANLLSGPEKEEFLKIFNTKKTMREISDEYLKSPEHLILLAKVEQKMKKKKIRKNNFLEIVN